MPHYCISSHRACQVKIPRPDGRLNPSPSAEPPVNPGAVLIGSSWAAVRCPDRGWSQRRGPGTVSYGLLPPRARHPLQAVLMNDPGAGRVGVRTVVLPWRWSRGRVEILCLPPEKMEHQTPDLGREPTCQALLPFALLIPSPFVFVRGNTARSAV